MKRFLMASALACLLAVSVMAGEISTSGSPSPGQIPTDGVAGQIPTDGAAGQIPTDGVAGQISDSTLSAVLMVLGLLS